MLIKKTPVNGAAVADANQYETLSDVALGHNSALLAVIQALEEEAAVLVATGDRSLAPLWGFSLNLRDRLRMSLIHPRLKPAAGEKGVDTPK